MNMRNRGKRIALTIPMILVLSILPLANVHTETTWKKGRPEELDHWSEIQRPGVIPFVPSAEKPYVIAFSNGDMSNTWRLAFVKDMVRTGEEYERRYGIRFIWTNAHANSSKQLEDVQDLLLQEPDLLIISPNESGPLTIVKDWCEDAGVLLVCVDRGIDAEPGARGSVYKALVQMDNYKIGIANGISVVKKLIEKYGEPKGNLVEIPGILGSSPALHRSIGQRWVLSRFPKIRIVAMQPGDYERKRSYEAARDILQKWPRGSIDGMIGGCDESGLAFLKAAEEAGRTELYGYIWGSDGNINFLEKLREGLVEQTSEHSPYFGSITFEHSIRLLNGETIPPVIMIPGRDFQADTHEKREALDKAIQYCKQSDLLFIPPDFGFQSLFQIDTDQMNEYYPVPYYLDEDMRDSLSGIKPYAIEMPYGSPPEKEKEAF
jgi:ribose transport system substrate-binding protein